MRAYIKGMALNAVARPVLPGFVLSGNDRRLQVAGAVFSLLLHLAAAYALLFWPLSPAVQPPAELVVEVVTLPPPVPQRAPPPPEPPPPAPPMAAVPPPPPPQLQEAPLAERSVPPPVAQPAPPRARPTPPAPVRTRREPTDAPAAPPAPANPTRADAVPVVPVPAAPESGGVSVQPRGGQTETVVSQAVQDFILMQVARHWLIDFQGPRFRDLELRTKFILLPNGMLAAPFGKNDPWDLAVMAPGYEAWPQRFQQAALTFLQAVRLAQPFRVPPGGRSDQPRELPLHFLLGEMRARS